MKNKRVLGEGVTVDNETRGINSNDLITGTSGAGKTRGYVIPNLFHGNDSKIVADTKGNLFRRYAGVLRDMGYRVENIDFVNPERSTIGYNPLAFIKKDKNGQYSPCDIKKIAEAVCPEERCDEIFWPQQAQMYIEFAISYVMESNTEEYQDFSEVEEIFDHLKEDSMKDQILELSMEHPKCPAVKIYPKIHDLMPADKTHGSVMGFVNNALNRLADSEICELYSMKNRIDFKSLGREKTVLFLTVSDTDSTRETLINLLYIQALQELIHAADENEDSRLEVPVRIILDDFASNVVIPDFDKIISNVRSRGISISVIVQSITQLYSMYGESKAMTILDNCDTQLYLGGQNVKTAEYFGVKMNKQAKTLLSLPLEKECVFIRGQEPRIAEKYDLSAHEEELIRIKEGSEIYE